MIRPDFRDYKNSGNELMHSAKGTTWGKHKYIEKKVVGGRTRYIYATKKPNILGRIQNRQEYTSKQWTPNNSLYKNATGAEREALEYVSRHKLNADNTGKTYYPGDYKSAKATKMEEDVYSVTVITNDGTILNTKVRASSNKKEKQADKDIEEKLGTKLTYPERSTDKSSKRYWINKSYRERKALKSMGKGK